MIVPAPDRLDPLPALVEVHRGGVEDESGLGLLDPGGEQVAGDGAAVDILEGNDILARPDAVEFDQPLQEVRVGHLPERVFAFSEKLIQQAGDRVGEGVGIQPMGREGIPLPFSVQAQLDVVLFPAGRGQDLADLMAEVTLHFEHEPGRPPIRIGGLPGEELPREGLHAGGRFAGADRSEDGDSGEEPPLGNHEPFWIGHLPRLDRMVDLADDDGRRRVIDGCGPGRERPGRRPPAFARHDPDAPAAQHQHAAQQDRDAGRGDIPHLDGGQDAGRCRPDQDEGRDGGGVGKRPDDGAADRGRQPQRDEDHVPPPHQMDPPNRVRSEPSRRDKSAGSDPLLSRRSAARRCEKTHPLVRHAGVYTTGAPCHTRGGKRGVAPGTAL